MSSVRCVLQLSLLGALLYPIFSTDSPCLVLSYVYLFMLPLSSYETGARSPKRYPGMLKHSLLALGGGVSLMGAMVLLIVAPRPWYNAHYLIPLTGAII